MNYVEDSAGGADVTLGILPKLDRVTLLQVNFHFLLFATYFFCSQQSKLIQGKGIYLYSPSGNLFITDNTSHHKLLEAIHKHITQRVNIS